MAADYVCDEYHTIIPGKTAPILSYRVPTNIMEHG
jgi:hypothetical protein